MKMNLTFVIIPSPEFSAKARVINELINSLTEVMHVIVKYKAVTYIVLRDGPLISSGPFDSFDHMYE